MPPSPTLIASDLTGILGAGLPPGLVVVGECSTGSCGGEGPPQGARTILQISRDGGQTWTAGSPIDAAAVPVGATAHDHVLLLRDDPQSTTRFDRLEWYPSGDRVTPPAMPGIRRPAVVRPDGTVLWWSHARLVRADGSVALDLQDLLRSGETATGVSAVASVDGRRLFVDWAYAAGGRTVHEWSVFVVGEQGRFHPMATYSTRSLPGAAVYADGAAWVDDSHVALTAPLTAAQLQLPASAHDDGAVPVLLDVTTGRLAPVVQPFLDNGDVTVTDAVVAVQHEPFASAQWQAPTTTTFLIQLMDYADDPAVARVRKSQGVITAKVAGAVCASADARTDPAPVLVLGAAGQPAACGRAGAAVTLYNGQGHELWEHFTVHPGTRAPLWNYGPMPAS